MSLHDLVWHPTPVLLPGKFHGRRSLGGCSPWGREESDATEQLHFHFALSCIGVRNGNPLQCSCLENPRDGEPGGLPSMGSHRVRHDWSDLASARRVESKLISLTLNHCIVRWVEFELQINLFEWALRCEVFFLFFLFDHFFFGINFVFCFFVCFF